MGFGPWCGCGIGEGMKRSFRFYFLFFLWGGDDEIKSYQNENGALWIYGLWGPMLA
jgi:hypothetical protein